MNPWDILGWLLVMVAGALLLSWLHPKVAYVVQASKGYRRHLQTRDTPPAKGQRWMQDGDILEITNIFDNGVIGVRCGGASWGDSPETWQERVRNRRLFLLQ